MKILYVSQYFPPEMGAPAARVSELAKRWVAAGHDVTVLTGFPNHPTGRVPAEYRSRMRRLVWRERWEGIQVVRTWLWPLPNRKAHERMLNYSSFCLSASLTGLTLPRPDALIATSPQLLAGVAGWWLSVWKRAPFILEVRDLWPESLEAVGAAGSQSLMMKTLRFIADFLYRRARRIVVVTPAFERELVEGGRAPQERIDVVENGVETELFAPADSGSAKKALGLEGRFVVSYIGTLGMAHGLETVLRSAALLQERGANPLFLLVGEGAEKEKLLRLQQELQLRNVRFVSEQPRERIPEFIRASDVCLVTLRKAKVFKTVIPTKMLEFLSCGRPVIADVEGQAREILDESGGGIAIAPQDPGALADAVQLLSEDADFRSRLGANGRAYIVDRFSRKGTAEKYLRLLSRVVERRPGARSEPRKAEA